MLKRHLPSFVYCTIIHESQDIESTSVRINGWMGKENAVHIHHGILFGIKKGNLVIYDV